MYLANFYSKVISRRTQKSEMEEISIHYSEIANLEKANERMDREAQWKVVKVLGVGGKLLRVVKAFYENRKARVNGNEIGSSVTGVGVRQGCAMSTWMLSVDVNDVIKDLKVRTQAEAAETVRHWKV